MEIFKKLPFYLQENVYGAYLEAQRDYHTELIIENLETENADWVNPSAKKKTIMNKQYTKIRKIISEAFLSEVEDANEVEEVLAIGYYTTYFINDYFKYKHTFNGIDYTHDTTQKEIQVSREDTGIFMFSQLPFYLQEVVFDFYLEAQRQYHIDRVYNDISYGLFYWSDTHPSPRGEEIFNDNIEKYNDNIDQLEDMIIEMPYINFLDPSYVLDYQAIWG